MIMFALCQIRRSRTAWNPQNINSILPMICKIHKKGLAKVLRYNLQAQYWHDPLAEEEFQAKSLFLADINNEGPRKNSSYAENLSSVDNLVLIKFTKVHIMVR